MFKVLLLPLLFLSFNSWSSEIKIVTEDVPPMQILNPDASLSGVNIEIVKAILNEAQLEASFEVLPWPRAFDQALNNKNTLILSMIRNPQREDKFIWLAKLIKLEPNITILKDRKDLVINTVADLINYKVAVSRGDYGENYLKSIGLLENRNLYLTVKHENMWKMLFRKRVDAVFTNNLTSKYEILSAGLSPSKVEDILDLNSISKELYLAANLNTDIQIVNALKKAAIKIKNNGTYQNIIDKWQN